MKTIVMALGGNAIIRKGDKETYSTLMKNIGLASKTLSPIIKNHRAIITHGNGSEIGFLVLQNEFAKKKVPPMPLNILGAETQGLIGYPLEEQLLNELRNTNKQIATIITQVLVDKKDPAFKNPTKFIGPFYSRPIKGYLMKKDSNKGYRRVVPSPKPTKILEISIIKKLVKENVLVIAAGGGGIPVYKHKNKLKGIEAVIDKDFSSELLGRSIHADILMMLTNVPNVYLNYGTKNQKVLSSITVKQAKEHLKQGQFPPGNMGPKIEAAINFLKAGGKRVIITDIKNAEKALRRKTGTIIQR